MGRWKCQTKRTYRLVPELKPIRPGAPGATPLTAKPSAAHALARKSTGGRESVRNRSAVPTHVGGGLPTRHAARRGDDRVSGDGDATVHDACLRAWRSDRNAQRRRDEKDEDEAHPGEHTYECAQWRTRFAPGSCESKPQRNPQPRSRSTESGAPPAWWRQLSPMFALRLHLREDGPGHLINVASPEAPPYRRTQERVFE